MFRRDRCQGGRAARRAGLRDRSLRAALCVARGFEPLEQRLPLHSSALFSEVMYHPPAPTDTELSSIPAATATDFEFVELLNPSATDALDLLDMQLGGDIQFTLPDEQLAPGEMLVVAANPAAFVVRYGQQARVLGPWQGQLADDVARLSLADDDGHVAVELQLAGSPLWPFQADGLGASLELIDPLATSSDRLGKPDRWQASFAYGGTPGMANSSATGVVINEVFAGLDPAGGATDQVELLNTSTAPIDLAGWYLGNSATAPLQFALPDDTVLAPGEFLVLDADDFNPTPANPGPGDFAIDAVHGDRLLLTRADDSGRLVRLEDGVRIGPSAGQSWGRDPALVSIFTTLAAPTFGTSNVAVAVGPLVISELNFHPAPPSPAALALDPTLTADDLEYVELYNPTLDVLDLSDWSLGGVVDWTFAAGTQLAADQTLVVVKFDPRAPEAATRLEAFRQHYGIDDSTHLLGPYSGDQPNDYGQVTVLQPGQVPDDDPEFTPRYLRDEVRYDDVAPWPAEAVGNGSSLDRLAADVPGLTADSWIAKAPTPGYVDFAPPPQSRLPDLVIWDDPLVGLNYFYQLDVHPRNGRQIMRFTTAVANVGQGPLIVRGGEVVDNQQQVLQVVENDDGTTSEYAAGQYVFHPTHGHVHFSDYAAYRLYEVAADGGLGAQVAGGEKVSFCLLDTAPYDTSYPGAPPFPVYNACERQTQGISVGWADVYTSDLDDQWIDIQDLPAGEYWFETAIDPFNHLLESDETNNTIRHKVVLGVPQYAPDAIDAAGKFEASLGVGDKQLSQLSIHEPGDVDTFRWVAADDGTLDVNLAFDHSLGDIDLYVWSTDAEGKRVLQSATTEQDGEHLNLTVSAGKSYFVVVKELSGDTNPAYQLTIDGPEIVPDNLEPNNSILEPTYLGHGNQALQDLTIHSPTDRDFFAWTAPETATLLLDLRFSSIQGHLDLFVHDFANNQVASSQTDQGRQLLEVPIEQDRTYLIIVQGRDGDMVNGYDLTLDVVNIPVDAFEPNDDYTDTAFLAAGDRQLSGLTIHKPFNGDFYRWQAPADGPAVVDLLFAQAEGDLDLILWEGGESFAFSGSATDNEQIAFTAVGGHTYVVEVAGKNGAVQPQYELNIDGPEATPDSYEPNDSLDTARDLGAGDVQVTDANLHESFNSDFYRWQPLANGVVRADLLFRRIEGDLDLVLWADGAEVELAAGQTDNEHLFVYVDAHREYAWEVRGRDGAINPHYELHVDGPERSPDDFEPNDLLAEAHDLGSGDVLLTDLNIHVADNSDFYRWSASADGSAVIDLLFSQADGDLDLAVWIDGQQTLLAAGSDDNEQLTLSLVAGQSIVVEVRGKDGATNHDYSLRIDGPDAPRVASVEVGKASVPDRLSAPITDAGEVQPIAWLDWQRIQIGFSEDVTVQSEDLRIQSDSGTEYVVSDFAYDASARTATWTLASAPVADRLTLTLSDNITDAAGNHLDGDAADLRLPSGDGVPGGAFVLVLEIRPGDFHADGQLDALDIDAVAAAIRLGDPLYDLSDDGQTTSDDIVVLVHDLMGTTIGDVNLDGRFNSTDLVLLLAAGQFEDDVPANSTWVTGDLNGDGDFSSSDLVFALQIGGYEA